MNFERYTTKAAEAVQGTLELAATLGQQALGPLHVLLILLNQKEGLVPTLLQKLEHNPDAVSERVKKALSALPKVTGGTQPYLTQDLKKIFDQAESEAGKLKDEYISTEHLFLALLDQEEVQKVLPLKKKEVFEIGRAHV